MRILIAEDDPVLADALRCTLRKSGYAVDWVDDGQGADAALGADEFDLLILDISLPKLSGFEVLKPQLVDHLCGWGEEVSANAIEVYVHRLRKKLDRGGVRISTIRGAGYRLDTLAAEAR